MIAGAGYGHGVGMSQDGALGYAEHGYSYQRDPRALLHRHGDRQASPSTNVRVLVGNAKVQTLALERYVRGVVSAEVSASWPLAALEAQAIASRTYALTAHAGGSKFDVYADTRSQVYRGGGGDAADERGRRGDGRPGRRPTRASRAITYFFASSGGRTENVEDSFLGSRTGAVAARRARRLRRSTDAQVGRSMSFAAAGKR